MAVYTSMDALVRQKLRTWPQHPPGLADHDMGASGAWIRARPGTPEDPDQPHLKLPGSNRLRTNPDGLWFRFGGTEADPADWLMRPVSATNPMPRWRYTGLLRRAPGAPLVLPVRDIRVMYALPPRHYAGFAASQIPHAHEFFAPISALIGPEGWQHPHLRAFIARTSTRANFFDYPGVTAA